MAAKPRQGTSVGCSGCAEWATKYHELVRELMTMKREGFIPQPSGGEPVIAPELPAVVRQAIGQVSTVGSGTWRHLTKYAWDAMRNGIEEKQIAADILAGEQEAW